jgi:hypothetical protein
MVREGEFLIHFCFSSYLKVFGLSPEDFLIRNVDSSSDDFCVC